MGGSARAHPTTKEQRSKRPVIDREPIRVPGFIVRPEAESDLDEAFAWYEDRSTGLGEQFLAAVEAAIDAVRTTPQRFPGVHEEPDLSIRRALIRRFPYGVYFIWDEERGVTSVIACMHAARDPRRWLERA